MRLLKKQIKAQRFQKNSDGRMDEIRRLSETLDMKVISETKRLAYHRSLCSRDISIGRLCDAQEQLLWELMRLNWRYRHE